MKPTDATELPKVKDDFESLKLENQLSKVTCRIETLEAFTVFPADKPGAISSFHPSTASRFGNIHDGSDPVHLRYLSDNLKCAILETILRADNMPTKGCLVPEIAFWSAIMQRFECGVVEVQFSNARLFDLTSPVAALMPFIEKPNMLSAVGREHYWATQAVAQAIYDITMYANPPVVGIKYMSHQHPRYSNYMLFGDRAKDMNWLRCTTYQEDAFRNEVEKIASSIDVLLL